MAESLVQVTEGSGKKLHTWQRTIGANNVEDEVVLPGEPYLATYSVSSGSVSCATGSSHLLQIMAGASLNVYLRRIWIYQTGAITTAAFVPFTPQRLSSAGTGGTVLSPSAYDTTDPAVGATAMSLPTVKGTETGAVPGGGGYGLPVQTLPTGGAAALLLMLDFDRLKGKSIRIPAGAANGIAISNRVAAAGLTVAVIAEFSEANF